MEAVGLENLVVFLGHNRGKYPSANAVLVEDDVRLLVDPSIDLDKAGRSAVDGPVDLIINSHAHEDHFAANHLFPEAQIAVHEKEVAAMSSLQALMESYGFDGAANEDWAKIVVDVFHYQPREDMRVLQDGDVIDLGRTKVHCIHAPGHTGGHMVLRFEPHDVLFVADLDLTAFGPYYGDACSSLEETIRSLRKLSQMSNGANACVSSHQAGIVRQDIKGTVDRFLDVIWERDDKLLAFVAEPKTLEEVAERCIVYGKPYPHIPWQPYAERTMMRMHAERLQAEGRMAVDPDGRMRAL